MNVDLAKYANKKICIAVSGGKDSMALLHYVYKHGAEYGITLCAVNCDHQIRGEASARDSAFVKETCEKWEIPLDFYKADCAELARTNGLSVETFSREWRKCCYFSAVTKFKADAVATAHHMNDNAETVLFNLARGAGLSGATGITEGVTVVNGDICGGQFNFAEVGSRKPKLNFIRPLISCTRGEIDAYIKENGIPFVEDETNSGDDYTRNYIRHNVIPQLENAVPSAVKAIYRFSRLAAEDEEYFESILNARNLLNRTIWGVQINFCREKPLFTRAAVKALKLLKEDIRDYTFGHIERLYNLQFSQNGKKFEFLNFTAFAENGGIAVCRKDMLDLKLENAVPFENFILYGARDYCGQYLAVCPFDELEKNVEYLRGNSPFNLEADKIKTLKFDLEKIPESAAVRFMREGDKFTKFGGGTKNLGDYFTDKKIPLRLRGQIPLVADGNEILLICGIEISDKIKITDETRSAGGVVCADYARL